MGRMGTTIATALPLLGLRITAGPVELRGITDDLLGPLTDLAIDGIHEPDFMPFTVPWSTTPAAEMPLNVAQYHWRVRSEFSLKKWSANFAVSWEGELVGTQGIETQNYLVTRSGETGSWLSRRFQGRGIGTAMRQVICAFVFDHLDAEYVTSEAFTDNPASLAVSRKVGYEDQGWRPVDRLGQQARLRHLLLEPTSLVRYGHPLTVSGVTEFRRSIGLDAPAAPPGTGSILGCTSAP
jgi:RimJ/RimL family protein N-acetyltransferase